MGVDYFICVICETISNDCMPTGHCQKCGGEICEGCLADQRSKYSSEGSDFESCDDCSPLTLDTRINEAQDFLDSLQMERDLIERDGQEHRGTDGGTR